MSAVRRVTAPFSIALLGFLLALSPPAGAARAGVVESLQMSEDAAPLRQVADEFVALALSGDAAAVRRMLSPNLVGRLGEATVQRALQQQILPFFAQGRGTARSVTITRTTDAAGSQGFAFYMWLAPTAGGDPRPFALYAVREGGRIVVANVVPDRLVEGRHQ
jgi:hypothetical protein